MPSGMWSIYTHTGILYYTQFISHTAMQNLMNSSLIYNYEHLNSKRYGCVVYGSIHTAGKQIQYSNLKLNQTFHTLFTLCKCIVVVVVEYYTNRAYHPYRIVSDLSVIREPRLSYAYSQEAATKDYSTTCSVRDARTPLDYTLTRLQTILARARTRGKLCDIKRIHSHIQAMCTYVRP